MVRWYVQITTNLIRFWLDLKLWYKKQKQNKKQKTKTKNKKQKQQNNFFQNQKNDAIGYSFDILDSNSRSFSTNRQSRSNRTTQIGKCDTLCSLFFVLFTFYCKLLSSQVTIWRIFVFAWNLSATRLFGDFFFMRMFPFVPKSSFRNHFWWKQKEYTHEKNFALLEPAKIESVRNP